ncbi:MFS transporter [Novosphingobium sp. B 225]|uniref:MFS transporter n=1 Tax=Novosphingobium sp. B 225 TaxID=1961849 RepID=UPI000B4ADD74|nr:MFS transporter [Novosphingobium sp. B 225]
MALPPTPASGPGDPHEGYPVSRAYAWLAFAMTFALMLSDYMSRQIINAVFPFLKAEWSLSDGQLGSLVGVVALAIGVLSVPISFMADRFGRVRSAAVMALVWGLATVACGLSGGYYQLLAARALVGAGEAGYGSAGAAILTQSFPARMHATVIGSFLSAGMIGSVIGVVLGGYAAQSLGWGMAFILIGVFGVALAVMFPLVIREPARPVLLPKQVLPIRDVLKRMAGTPTLLRIAAAGACGMFVQTSFLAWMPSYLNRYYGLDPATASLGTGAIILCGALGTIAGGAIVDRFARERPANRLRLSGLFALILGLAMLAAFLLPLGPLQLALIALGFAVSTSYLGPALAAAGDVTPEANHATTYALISLAYMLLGAAPGPILTGYLADASELSLALGIIPVLAVAGGLFFFAAAKSFPCDVERLGQTSA